MKLKTYYVIALLGLFLLPINAQEVTELQKTERCGNKECCHSASEPRYGLKTNFLSWCALTPQGEMDFFFGNHWNLAVGMAYGWWGFTGDQKALQSWRVTAEQKYYFRKNGHYGHALGLRGETGQFDFLLHEYGRRGKFGTLGVTYTYTFKLDKQKRWYLDLGLGGGYIYADYTKYKPYEPTECYHRVFDKVKNTFGLTNVFINIGYRFPVETKKCAKEKGL